MAIKVFAVAAGLLCHVVAAAPASPSGHRPSRLHGRFLHITDFHPDDFYKVHTSTAAHHACHSGKGPAGSFGAETSDCDSPISLVDATFDWIAANLGGRIDFVVWTGDSARHDSDEHIPRSPAQVLGSNRMLAKKFADAFSGPHGLTVPVVPNFGNNDILPHNILPPGPNRWLSYYADIWKPFIPEEQRHSFEFGGWFYVEVIPNNLAVFSLNTLYLFDRNAAVDDCVKPSEPGFKHMEWLRIQLQFMRDRGMKAILIGHVPPARTDSKRLWDETCWQKYTLWLRQYRDVVITGLFGHMNIDHFVISDSNDITIDSSRIHAQHDVLSRESLQDELSVRSAADYLEELRQGWAKLPKVQWKSKETDSQNMKGYKGNKDRDKKLGSKWAERYQLSFVSPSIVPNYFPTLRVYDYNITGLEYVPIWAEHSNPLPTTEKPSLEAQDPAVIALAPELELRALANLEVQAPNWDVDDAEADRTEADHVKADKKKKDKKKRRRKKKKRPKKDTNLHVPVPPAKTAPPGPAYSPQPLTLLGYTQYFANLTRINNVDFATTEQFEDNFRTPARWREGKHGGKIPRTKKPKPREFNFEIEYTTYDAKLYDLKDLSVRSFVDLAYRMGQSAKGKAATQWVLPGGDISDDDLGRAQMGEGHDLDFDEAEADHTDDLERLDGTEWDADEKKKKKRKGDKKKSKLNKVWLRFLKHAYVSTVDDDELQEKFS